jgi:hypothetical protein
MGSVVFSFLYTKVPPLLNRVSDSLAKLAAAIQNFRTLSMGSGRV